MTGFQRSVTGRVVGRLDVVERGLLRSLAEQVVDLVTPETAVEDDPLAEMVGITPDAQEPTDPALARLLPAGYDDDPEAAAEFRRFTDRSLRDLKLAHARRVLADLENSGDKVRLSDDGVAAWLGFLTDARLTLGVRLGVTAETLEELSNLAEDDPRAAMYFLYDWLTYLQETLVRAAMPT
jgi:hypothetical protein